MPQVAVADPQLASLEAQSEAQRVLTGLAYRKTSSLPTSIFVQQALRVYGDQSFAMQRAACETLLRRVASATREQIKVVQKPGSGSPFGVYLTQRRGATGTPYKTLLTRIAPLEASCSCADFRRASLGLCKHVVAVLLSLAKAAKRFEKIATRGIEGPALRWDAVRPLLGLGDWLSRVSLTAAPSHPLQPSFTDPQRLEQRRQEFVTALLNYLERHPLDGEPALLPLLRQEQQLLTRKAQGAAVARQIDKHLRSMKVQPYRYQREGVARFVGTGRLLLADDMGLGKTAQAIASAHVLWHSGKVRRGLIVAPAALKSQWQREWSMFTDVDVTVVDGTPSERQAIYKRAKSGFLIANYEQLWRDLEFIQRFAPQLVVLDEAQRIKNWATKTAHVVKQLTPELRLVLTGTPMENRLDELSSLLDWVDDTVLAPTWRLAPWHLIQSDGKRETGGMRNLDTLRTRLAGCMLRRLRSEVLSQLPSRTDTVIPVELTAAQHEAHEALTPQIARLVATNKSRPLSQPEFLRLMTLLNGQRMICNGLALKDFAQLWPGIGQARGATEALLPGLSSPKLLEVRELVSRVALEQGRKVVVFSQWRRMLELAHWATHDLMTQAQVKSAFFTGNESQKRRTQNIVDFHDDPSVRVLWATDAGGVGLNLQRAASCVVNLDLPWNPAVLEQRIGRVHRNGQTEPVQIYNLVCTAGIEARVADLVGNKQAAFSGLFDGKSDEVVFESAGSFLSRVEKLLDAPVVASTAAYVEGDADLEATTSASEDGAGLYDEAAATAGPREADGGVSSSAESPEDARESVDLGALLSQLKVQQTPGGEMQITVPPAVVPTFANLLVALGRQLGAT